MSGRFYIGFLPWVVFDVVTRSGGLSITWGSACALVAAVGIALWRQKLTALEILAIVLFAVTYGLAGADMLPKSVVSYSRTWSTVVLAVFAIVSAVTFPFAKQYTRHLVARPVEESVSFQHVNYVLSMTWGIIFVLVAASHAIGTLLDGPMALSLFHWLVPIFLVIAGCYASQRIWNTNIDESVYSASEAIGRLSRTLESPSMRHGERGTDRDSPVFTVVRENRHEF